MISTTNIVFPTVFSASHQQSRFLKLQTDNLDLLTSYFTLLSFLDDFSLQTQLFNSYVTTCEIDFSFFLDPHFVNNKNFNAQFLEICQKSNLLLL